MQADENQMTTTTSRRGPQVGPQMMCAFGTLPALLLLHVHHKSKIPMGDAETKEAVGLAPNGFRS